jgi:hypothetical protein
MLSIQSMKTLVALALPLALALVPAACSKPAEGASADSLATVTGTATFRDAPTDAEDTHVDAAAPVAQRGSLWLTLRGAADIDGNCPDASANTYVASYTGAALIDHGQLRAALYPASTPPTTTPSGCAVSRLEVHGVEDARFLLEIPTSSTTCANFCAGHARARSSQSCENTSDQAACRAGIEPGTTTACEQTCMQKSAGIAGAGAITQAQLPTLDADDLQRGALGDIQAAFVLDHLVDANRQPVTLK